MRISWHRLPSWLLLLVCHWTPFPSPPERHNLTARTSSDEIGGSMEISGGRGQSRCGADEGSASMGRRDLLDVGKQVDGTGDRRHCSRPSTCLPCSELRGVAQCCAQHGSWPQSGRQRSEGGRWTQTRCATGTGAQVQLWGNDGQARSPRTGLQT